ncbi:hypothetical protein [Sphingorhabdus sp.]|jgi:hypothetical protein|uniref:hypothetical protein n=1 Tax=Sphingorhabdus sp. TaxID=1902408 RepID=UPI0037CCA9E6
MSRLLVAAMALSASVASAQPVRDDEIAKQIEKARRLVAVDAEGCVKYPATDEIVVCGENPDNKSQRMFRDAQGTDEDRIRRGEAISSKRAAACLRGDTNCKIYMKGVSMGFGYVPPPAIPLEEVLKGLPEPDMIVTDGENAPP